MHFHFFESIDWLTISSTKKCKLIIAPIVIDELDKHKVDNSKKAKRARKALNKLEEYHEKEQEIKKGILIEIILSKPSKKTFKRYNLVNDEPDQKLLASLHEFCEINPNAEVYLCTDDVGARLRAKSHDVNILSLPDALRLTADNSAKDRQINDLQAEIRKLKFKVPKLSLQFENGENFNYYKIQAIGRIDSEFVEKEISLLKDKFPRLRYLDTQGNKSDRASVFKVLLDFNQISIEQVNNYNRKLEEFFTGYAKFLEDKHVFDNKKKLTIPIRILLANKGTIPADNIDVHLHFPDGFELVAYSEFMKTPTQPEPPAKPKSQFESFQPYFPLNLNPDISSSNVNITNKPTITKTNSYNVDFSWKYLKHNYTGNLDALIAIYSSTTEMKNFEIDYRVTSANTLEPIIGKLKVIFKR